MESALAGETNKNKQEYLAGREKPRLTPGPPITAGQVDIYSRGKTNAASIFVIRIWGEWSAGDLDWRGRIEHLPNGQTATFASLEEISTFIQQVSRWER